MKLSPVYLRWREDTLEQGKKEGLREGLQEGELKLQRTIENFFKVRFGSVDSELSAIVEPMLQLPRAELTRLLLSASREELLERFGG